MAAAETPPDPQIIHHYLIALNTARRTYQRAPTSQHEEAYQALFDWFKAHGVALRLKGQRFVLTAENAGEDHG